MIAPNPNVLCERAESYYYDFLSNVNTELIPEYIFNHIRQCTACQEQVNQLLAVLSESEEHLKSERREVSLAVTEMLRLHFSYIGKPVTCEIVKPFLSSMLDPALEMRVPTPITTHLDSCKQCREDLETIRSLNLSHKQIRRLSRLFAEKTESRGIDCAEAQSAIPSVISMVFNKTDTEVLKHLCVCPDCRRLLYERREMVLRGLRKTEAVESSFPCEKVSARDFFDYVIPYGIDPVNDQYAKFRESLTSHLRTCPACLAKMQQMHDAVYGIVERAESEVVTIYHIDESAKAKAIGESDDFYAGFPVRVEVVSRGGEVKAEQSAPAIDFAAARRRRVSARKLKPLLRPALAAAAVILVAVVLLLNMPTAQATNLERIYKALEEVRNVYIAKFVPEKAEPMQEKWVSRALNIYMTKTAGQYVFWDVANEVTKIKYPGSGTIETTRLSAEDIAAVEGKVSGSLGLMPFYGISNVPVGAEWSRVTGDELEAAARDAEVYDLKWVTKGYGGSVVFQKWRVFVDADTSFPQKVEWYKKSGDDTDYVLMSLMTIERLSDIEMQGVIEEASF